MGYVDLTGAKWSVTVKIFFYCLFYVKAQSLSVFQIKNFQNLRKSQNYRALLLPAFPLICAIILALAQILKILNSEHHLCTFRTRGFASAHSDANFLKASPNSP